MSVNQQDVNVSEWLRQVWIDSCSCI